jgi:hypothetical protein
MVGNWRRHVPVIGMPLCAFLSAQAAYLSAGAPIHNFLLIILYAHNLNFTFNKINQVESK